MKGKTIVCVFAHPDDEAFGPSGTIARLAKDNTIYLLCATKGEANGNNGHERKHIGGVREQELLSSAKVLGIKKVRFLGFKDGTLSNNKYHKLAGRIENNLKQVKPEMIMTFEPQGVSGHIDHIVVCFATRYVFEKLSFIKELWMYCIDEAESTHFNDYFIYFPKGYKKSEVDTVIDVGDVWDQKIKAMRMHKSQKKDCDRIIQYRIGKPKEEYFLVVKK